MLRQLRRRRDTWRPPLTPEHSTERNAHRKGHNNPYAQADEYISPGHKTSRLQGKYVHSEARPLSQRVAGSNCHAMHYTPHRRAAPPQVSPRTAAQLGAPSNTRLCGPHEPGVGHSRAVVYLSAQRYTGGTLTRNSILFRLPLILGYCGCPAPIMEAVTQRPPALVVGTRRAAMR